MACIGGSKLTKDRIHATKAEIETSGFHGTDVVGVIGPCWLIPQLDEFWKDEPKRESIMCIVRMCEKEESILGLSTHLISISRKE